jgi:hypothetical protein
MRSIRSAALIAALGLASGVAHAGAYDSAVTIRNDSLWAINQIYLSAVDVAEWGPDQLGRHVVGTGESFKLTGIPCDDYDVKLVDEDGDECVVGDVALCGDKNDTWVITDEDLLTCQVLTED